jgi:arylformamidase
MGSYFDLAIDRRTMVATGVAGGVALAAAGGSVMTQTAAAQPAAPAGEKGPPVWLDMDQKQLDDAYDQSKYAPNIQQVVKRYGSNSEITREKLGVPKRFSYGPTPVEALDVFTTKRPNAPILIFVHGGAWRGGAAKEYSFPAEAFVNAGAHYAALDFINVLEAGGDLMPMAEQVRRAVSWVAKNAAQFGGDASRIYLAGHSSGAHLGGVALVTDWQKDFGVPADVIKGAVLISGMYDLKPVRMSARSNYVKFTDASEEALSTQRHLAKVNCPVALLNGSLETPEFLRQSRDFAAAMQAAGKPVSLQVVANYNHFEIMETLGNPYGAVGRTALDMMKLSAS